MTTSRIVKADKIKIDQFKISDNIKTNKYQGKSVFTSYNGSAFRVQMPVMVLPFGVGKYESPDSSDIKYSLDMSAKDVDPKIIELFEGIEESVLDYAEKNSKELFKKQQSKTILKEFYKSFIKYSEDENGERSEKYPARFKAKLWTSGNDFSADVFKAEKVDGKYPKVNMTIDNCDEILSAGSKCEVIIQCSGLWVVGKSFGISWSVSQIKAYTNENSLSGYAFQDDEDEEAEETENIEEFDEMGLGEEESLVDEKPKRVRRKKEDF